MSEHYHFCPGCGYAVVCPIKRNCFYLKNGQRCVDCGGTWKRPAPVKDKPAKKRGKR